MHQDETRAKQPSVWKGVAAGAIGGIVASWVMDEFQSVWMKGVKNGQSQNGSNQLEKSNEQEPATVKAAEMVSEKLFGHHLENDEKQWAGNAVHYVTGGTSGAVYGLAAELAPGVTSGIGVPFGTAVWLGIDEGAVPLLGLAKGPTEYPVATHVYALASHFVYGLTTECLRRALRSSVLK
jgi:putative membrane protein